MQPLLFLQLLCLPRPSASATRSPAAAAAGGRKITAAGQKDMDLIAGRVECTLPSYGL